MFLSVYSNQNLLNTSNTYFNENGPKFLIVELLCFFNDEIEMKFKVCQKLTQTPDKYEILIIIDQNIQENQIYNL